MSRGTVGLHAPDPEALCGCALTPPVAGGQSARQPPTSKKGYMPLPETLFMISTSRRWAAMEGRDVRLGLSYISLPDALAWPRHCRSRSGSSGGAEHSSSHNSPQSLCLLIQPGWISRGARGSSAGEEEGSAGCWGSRRPGSTSSGDALSCSSATMTDRSAAGGACCVLP